MRKGIILSSVFLLSMAEPVKVNTQLLVKAVDREGITHQLKGISCNGRTYLKVKEGGVDSELGKASFYTRDVRDIFIEEGDRR